MPRRVTLVIDHLPEGAANPVRHEFALDPERTGPATCGIFFSPPISQNFSYGYRFDGPSGNGHLVYDYRKILIDPCCQELLPRKWAEPAQYGAKTLLPDSQSRLRLEDDRPLKTPLVGNDHLRTPCPGLHQGSQLRQ